MKKSSININKYLFICMVIFTTITTIISCGYLSLTIVGIMSYNNVNDVSLVISESNMVNTMVFETLLAYPTEEIAQSTNIPLFTPTTIVDISPTEINTSTVIPTLGLIKEGTYIIGRDIRPGTYYGLTEENGFCHWSRLSDLKGEFESVIAFDSSSGGQYYVEVKESDYAFKTSCLLILVEQ